MVTQLMLSRYWGSSAFMWSYDGSGGWYDGVRPPEMGSATVGFRVPALLVSAYARQGQVNHTVLDYAGALKFIEQNWRLDPLAARDAQSNSLSSAFDFAASPRPPVLLHAGAAPDPLPVTHPLSHRQVTVVYLLYGGAATVSILLLAFAALSSARSARRRRPAPASRAAATKEAGG
jgi:phospholipase C